MANALEVSGGIHRGRRPTLGDPSQRHPIPVDRIEHSREVAEPVIEGGHAGVAIRQALPTLVVRNETSERRELGEPSPRVGVLPRDVDVRNDPRKTDERDLPLAEHLVGNAHVAVAGIAGFGNPCG
jgi:hypothetical protein